MLAVVNWLVQSMLNTAAMMLVQLAHIPTKPTKPTNLTDLDDQHVGWLAVEWAGSGKPVGQYGGFKISASHIVLDLLKWLAQQDEHLVNARLFVGQGGPEVEVDDVGSSADLTNLAKWACKHGLIGVSSSTSLTKLDGLVGMKSLVVRGGVLHQAVHIHMNNTFQLSPPLRRRLLRACERRWCRLTAGWAETVLCQSVTEAYACFRHVFAKLARLAINNHIQCKPFGSQRLLVAALQRLVWMNRPVDLPSATLAALVKAHLHDPEVVIGSCELLHRFDKGSSGSSLCLVVPHLLSRLDLAHCLEQLGKATWCDCHDQAHRRAAIRQIAESDRVPDLAELAGKPTGQDFKIYGSQDRCTWNASSILQACAEHIRADDLSSVVLAGLRGRHYDLLSELAKHHNGGSHYHGGFDKAFFAAEGPQLVLQHFMVAKLQTEVAEFLLSIWEPENAGPSSKHPAWACFGASICNMWVDKYRLYHAGDSVIQHLLGTNIHVREAFADSQPENLAKQLLASDPPDWLEHQIGCALSCIND